MATLKEEERFLVVARDRADDGILRTWGPYDRSYAESVRADKEHEIRNAILAVEPVAKR